MKRLFEIIPAIWKDSKGTIALMLLNLMVGAMLIISSLANLRPNELVIKIAYGDLSGYQDGAWYYLASFGVVGIMVAAVQNLIAVKIYRDKGRGVAGIFLIAGLLVGVAAWVMLTWVVGDTI